MNFKILNSYKSISFRIKSFRNAEDKKKSSHPGYEMGVKNDLIRTRVHENLLLLGTKVAQLLSQNCHECAEKLLLLLLLYHHCCSVQSQASMSLQIVLLFCGLQPW